MAQYYVDYYGDKLSLNVLKPYTGINYLHVEQRTNDLDDRDIGNKGIINH